MRLKDLELKIKMNLAFLCVFAREFKALKGRNKYRIRQRLISWELRI